MTTTTPSRFPWKSLRSWLFSRLGLHWLLFAALALATLVLGLRVALDSRTLSADNQDSIAGRQAELRAIQAQTKPLAGLPKRVELSREQIARFYARRVPPSYSAILEELGKIQATGPVRLTRVQYTQAPGAADLTEIRMDAGLSGNYPAILRFINGLERSQTFFVIRTMALTGQQSGTVNLRLQFSTWLRPADAAASGLPLDTTPPAHTTKPAQEGE